MDDILLVDKPSGLTSFGVVARVRRVLSEQAGKKVKVGHTGTLDPFATGLMILVTGKKCREASHFSKLDKIYEAEIVLGQTSSTGDPEGEIVKASRRQPSLDEVRQVVDSFKGEIYQTPPAYSAIKIDGQRAYKLARQGKSVQMPERKVEIFELEILSYKYPVLSLRAHVSSGTYIRSLAEDIGRKMDIGAYCRALRRVQISGYNVAEAKSLKDLGIES